MKPFNLERALAGDPVVTRDGLKIQAIHNFKNELFNILSVIVEGEIYKYSIEGRLINTYEIPTERFYLFMAPTKRKGWINLYNSQSNTPYVTSDVFSTKNDALSNVDSTFNNHIATIQIEWEE